MRASCSMRSTSIASGFLLFQIHFLLDDALKQLQMISEGVYLLFVSLKQLLMFKNEVDGCDAVMACRDRKCGST